MRWRGTAMAMMRSEGPVVAVSRGSCRWRLCELLGVAFPSARLVSLAPIIARNEIMSLLA